MGVGKQAGARMLFIGVEGDEVSASGRDVSPHDWLV